ncbi:FAD-dependent oxidoreductase [candidate division WOR-3 bacterium]|nr:FAD-dependent oxidoreductase [candidate division WOR-3 bacterium]
MADTDGISRGEQQNSPGAVLQLPDIERSFPIQEITTATCRVACPAGVNIKAYLGAIARGDFQRALDIVRETNPLPGICGRVCTHPCEAECRRGDFDDPLAICALKRFIADFELQQGGRNVVPIKQTKAKKISIIGSGPAGLTAANDLVRMGYGVTIFEELAVAGGMMVTGIPAYRLPRDIIGNEIQDIIKLGVELRTNTKIENVDRLFEQGYAAVFLAIGAHKGLKLKVPGEDDFEGIVDCIQFLRRVNAGKQDRPGDRVIVIGGGNSAVDSARSALRLGCQDVHIVYRRSRKEMPANEEEIVDAENEGIIIDYLAAPTKIIGEGGRVTGMECVKMKLGEPDASGRRRPVPIEGSEFVIGADLIISAISQKPDIDCFRNAEMRINKWDAFDVDEQTLMTSKPGVFAGGDAVTGPSTVIDAIAAGHRAAQAIDRYVQGKPMQQESEGVSLQQRELVPGEYTPEKRARIHARKKAVDVRKSTFDEVESTLSTEEAVQEARRCLRCGPCFECVHCVKECRKRVIGIETAQGKELLMVHGLPTDLKITPDTKALLSGDGKDMIPVHVEPIISTVDPKMCRGCGECEAVCDYTAITVIEQPDGSSVALVDSTVCKGCGTCVSVCPTGAARLAFFNNKDIESELEAFLGN